MKPIQSIEKFHFSIGGYDAMKFDVIVQENKATFCADLYLCKFGEKHQKNVSDKAMELFLKRLNQLDIIHWKKEYINPNVLDGVEWELEIAYNKTKKKKIYGTNLYPNSETDSDEISPIFEKLLSAIKELINEPLFLSDGFLSD